MTIKLLHQYPIINNLVIEYHQILEMEYLLEWIKKI